MQTQQHIDSIDQIIGENLEIVRAEDDAAHAFPLVDYVSESSVMHARRQWLAARKYLKKHNIDIKPLICHKVDKITYQ